MSRTLSIDVSIDDIEKQLRKYSWIDSYEIYLQSLTKLTSKTKLRKHEKPIETFQKRKISGVSLRYITKSRHLGEISVGISLIKKLADLEPPKSTQITSPLAVFQEITKPKLSSIVGDEQKTTKINSETSIKEFEKVYSLLNQEVHDGSSVSLELEKEVLEITNSHSNSIDMKSLRVNFEYQYQFNFPEGFILAKSDVSSRNLNFDYSIPIQNVSETIMSKLMPSQSFDQKETSILIHPEVIGRIIAFQSSLFLAEPPVELNENIWSENLYLYDDPLRENGYQSCFIDDEGTETKSKILIDKGTHVRGLHTLQHSKWKTGGNAFRNMWFHPIKHSFQYFLRKDATNLVLTGGTGRGNMFTQKSGTTLYIKKGHGYIGGIATNPYFVIHTSETELWKNGTLQGPTKNMTIKGSLLEIMKHGDFSADEYQVVDRAIPSAVYIGWLRLSPDLISIG